VHQQILVNDSIAIEIEVFNGHRLILVYIDQPDFNRHPQQRRNVPSYFVDKYQLAHL
jgi:hypothetical protein